MIHINKNYLVLTSILFIIAIFVGVLLFKNTQTNGTKMATDKNSMMKKDKSDAMMIHKGYLGELLAGKSSPYLAFQKKDYDKALAEGKVIVLDFYANWCPICRSEAPELVQGFNNLSTDKVVGFRVNFKDSDTNDDEKALASQFSIPYQHTKVILKDGKEITRSSDEWTADILTSEINKVL